MNGFFRNIFISIFPSRCYFKNASTSSSLIASSLSSAAASSSATSSTIAQPTKIQLNYKNPFFENYNIVYPEDWKFSFLYKL
jgi:hypothetical protein